MVHRKAHDTPLDQRPVELELRLVGVVVGRDVLLGEGRVDAFVHIELVELADQQRLAVGLDLRLDVVGRSRKELFGLRQLQLLADPFADIQLGEGDAVVARQPRRQRTAEFLLVERRAARLGQRAAAADGHGRHLPTADGRQQQKSCRYLRNNSHIRWAKI